MEVSSIGLSYRKRTGDVYGNEEIKKRKLLDRLYNFIRARRMVEIIPVWMSNGCTHE